MHLLTCILTYLPSHDHRLHAEEIWWSSAVRFSRQTDMLVTILRILPGGEVMIHWLTDWLIDWLTVFNSLSRAIKISALFRFRVCASVEDVLRRVDGRLELCAVYRLSGRWRHDVTWPEAVCRRACTLYVDNGIVAVRPLYVVPVASFV